MRSSNRDNLTVSVRTTIRASPSPTQVPSLQGTISSFRRSEVNLLDYEAGERVEARICLVCQPATRYSEPCLFHPGDEPARARAGWGILARVTLIHTLDDLVHSELATVIDDLDSVKPKSDNVNELVYQSGSSLRVVEQSLRRILPSGPSISRTHILSSSMTSGMNRIEVRSLLRRQLPFPFSDD